MGHPEDEKTTLRHLIELYCLRKEGNAGLCDEYCELLEYEGGSNDADTERASPRAKSVRHTATIPNTGRRYAK